MFHCFPPIGVGLLGRRRTCSHSGVLAWASQSGKYPLWRRKTPPNALAAALSRRSAALPRPASEPSAEPRLLTDSGGRLAWYHGAKHELLAFDAVTDTGSLIDVKVVTFSATNTAEKFVSPRAARRSR